MSIKKIVITKGIYENKELRLLVSFDENDSPLDIINLDNTQIGTVCTATVEKVISDIDSCICKLSIGEKGFIESKKLFPEYYLVRHSDKKKVCQGDQFYVVITQDKKGSKPFSCNFVKHLIDDYKNNGFIYHYINEYASSDYEIVSDLEEVINTDLNVRAYTDESYSLWNLYDLTKLLKNITSNVCHLKDGGNIVIEPTEALTVIDVNSSKNHGKGTAFDTNKQAIDEVIKQIRLRSISGIIIIDMLKVSKDEEQELIRYFKDNSNDDISNVSVHGFTHLGLLEITRSRNFSSVF